MRIIYLYLPTQSIYTMLSNSKPMLPTQEAIQAAFTNLIAAKEALVEASEKELTCRETLKTAEYEAIQDNKIDGKNEQTRKAQLAEIVTTEQDALCVAESEKRKAMMEAVILRQICKKAEILAEFKKIEGEYRKGTSRKAIYGYLRAKFGDTFIFQDAKKDIKNMMDEIDREAKA